MLADLPRILESSVVFDCRALPEQFLGDTGEATWHELEATFGKVQLPYPFCYFELPLLDRDGIDDGGAFAAIAWEAEIEQAEEDGGHRRTGVAIYGLPAGGDPKATAEWMPDMWGVFSNREPTDDGLTFFGKVPQDAGLYDKETNDGIIQLCAYMVLGVLTLLSERYVIDAVKPNPKPYLSAKRAKKGKPPISGEVHMLTLNVPAVRRAADRGNQRTGQTHSPPVLHWRRGHERVLYRGTENQRSTWVKKTLVGDPDKGYVRPSYRVVFRDPPAGARREEPRPLVI